MTSGNTWEQSFGVKNAGGYVASSHLPSGAHIIYNEWSICTSSCWNANPRKHGKQCHHHKGVPAGLGMGLPVAVACSFLRALNSPSIRRRSSCSAWEYH